MKAIKILVFMALLSSCTDSSTLELRKGSDMVVNLEMVDKEGVEKIEFQMDDITATASATDIKDYKNISFGVDGKGDGSVKVCVYVAGDTICSENYVEKGFQPQLKYSAKRIEVVSAGL